MQYLHLIWVWAGHITVLLCGILAIWRGGWAERSTAIVIWVAWFLTPVLQKQNYDPGMLITVMDGIVVLIVFSISCYSRRIWTLFMSVFVLASFLAHFAADLVPYVGYFSYLTAMGLLGGYGVALTLGGAALEAEYLRKKSTMHA